MQQDDLEPASAADMGQCWMSKHSEARTPRLSEEMRHLLLRGVQSMLRGIHFAVEGPQHSVVAQVLHMRRVVEQSRRGTETHETWSITSVPTVIACDLNVPTTEPSEVSVLSCCSIMNCSFGEFRWTG